MQVKKRVALTITIQAFDFKGRGSRINFVDPGGEGFKPKSLFRCAQRYFSVFSLQFANPFAFRSKTEKPCTFGARLFGLSG